MRAGNLKHKIVIQTYSETQNDYGEVVKGWADFKTAYAQIIPLSGKEVYISGVVAEATHKIRMRYRIRKVGDATFDSLAGSFDTRVDPKMRVLYGSRAFNIISAVNIREENKVLELICTEVV